MIDEGELRRRFPEIPWDQPVGLEIVGWHLWACRYCIALYGLSARLLIEGDTGERTKAYESRSACLDHIEERHHD